MKVYITHNVDGGTSGQLASYTLKPFKVINVTEKSHGYMLKNDIHGLISHIKKQLSDYESGDVLWKNGSTDIYGIIVSILVKNILQNKYASSIIKQVFPPIKDGEDHIFSDIDVDSL